MVADHLSRIVTKFKGEESNENFPDEAFSIKRKISQYADIVNYLVIGQLPTNQTA